MGKSFDNIDWLTLCLARDIDGKQAIILYPYGSTPLTICVYSWRRVQFRAVGRFRAFCILLSSELVVT